MLTRAGGLAGRWGGVTGSPKLTEAAQRKTRPAGMLPGGFPDRSIGHGHAAPDDQFIESTVGALSASDAI